MEPTLEICEDAEAAMRRAASFIAARLQEALDQRGRASLALSGGRTPARMCALLAAEDLAWTDIDVFQVDERIAPLDHQDRNAVLLRAAFGRRVDRSAERFHWMPVDGEDLEDAARRYAREIEDRYAALDVVHLGLGDDGHTASLFPGAPELEASERVTLTASEHLGRRRMTMTLPLINSARQIVWLVVGQDKRRVLARLIDGDPALVAGRVRRNDALIVTDVDAAPRSSSP